MNMAAGKLNSQDKKDLEKFTKFFIFKSLQIIVQSRLGEKIRTKSKPFSSGADWFNLAIRDIPEVHSEAKKVLSGQQSMLGQDVCVEISLRTAEGDTMVLETWYISLNKEQCEPGVKVSYTVYNRMGIALKSLFSVSRVPPAYRLARRQSANGGGDYVICYRIYLGDPQFFQLGDGYQSTKVGAIPTPVGTILLNLAYRTKLLISPHKTTKDLPFEVKDDHFKRDASPKLPTTPKPCSLGFRRNSTSDELLNVGLDRQDLCSTMFSTSPSSDLNINECGMALNTQPLCIINEKSTEDKDDHRPRSVPEKGSNSFTELQRVGAFATHRSMKDLKTDMEEIPFFSLLAPTKPAELPPPPPPPIEKLKSSITSGETDNMETTTNSAGSDINKSNSSDASAPDDFVMVELKTPFAGADANTDLGKFYRECQGAPNLKMFDEEESGFNETLEVVTNQLALFESDMKGFDEFVDSLKDQDSSG
ncbi:autophagy-related protein 13-like [Haliotis rufescens]|uniref:autophagy-related protein 13-like n=1 Tax=Haliotis rufescens TaxID=6454 RepID=UPI001EAFAB3B|nr:autophagy-related protein 13-like [Haliotis rufescens]